MYVAEAIYSRKYIAWRIHMFVIRRNNSLVLSPKETSQLGNYSYLMKEMQSKDACDKH